MFRSSQTSTLAIDSTPKNIRTFLDEEGHHSNATNYTSAPSVSKRSFVFRHDISSFRLSSSAECSRGAAAVAAKVAAFATVITIRKTINRRIAGQVAQTVLARDLEDFKASDLVIPPNGTQVSLGVEHLVLAPPQYRYTTTEPHTYPGWKMAIWSDDPQL